MAARRKRLISVLGILAVVIALASGVYAWFFRDDKPTVEINGQLYPLILEEDEEIFVSGVNCITATREQLSALPSDSFPYTIADRARHTAEEFAEFGASLLSVMYTHWTHDGILVQYNAVADAWVVSGQLFSRDTPCTAGVAIIGSKGDFLVFYQTGNPVLPCGEH